MKLKTKILLLFFLCTFIFSAIFTATYVYCSYNNKRELNALYEKLENSVEPTKKETKNEQLQNNSLKKISKKSILSKYENLYLDNSDLIGWISISNTTINYPVMQTKSEPLYYLHKNWNKEYSKYGLPFIDARNTLDSNNIIIYAHNMRDGSMFGSLKKYCNKNYYSKHSIIEFDSIYKKQKYCIIGILYSKVYYEEIPSKNTFLFYNYPNLSSKEEFEYYIKEVKKRSLFYIKSTAKYGDKLITLSTCSYHTKNGRLLIVAKKVF